MPQRPREIARPTELTTVAALLGRTDLSAGPLTVALRPAALAETEHDLLVDLSRLGLDAVTGDDRLIYLGAQTPVQALVDSPVIQAHAGGLLAHAARLAAPLTLRHLATVGAAWQAAGGPPEIKLALLALDAAPRLAEAGPAPLLTQLLLPVLPSRGLGAALERVARAARDEAIVAVAVKLCAEAGVARGVRVAIAGAAPQPQRFLSAEALLEGQAFTAERLAQFEAHVSAAAAPVANFRGSAEYRRALAGVLAARAVAAAWRQASA